MSQQHQYEYQPVPPLSQNDQRLWATLIHIGGIFFGILPSLIGYFALRDRGDFVKEHTRVALNFHINVIIAGAICGFLSLIVIGVFLAVVLGIVLVVCSILAAIAANDGRYYQYPLTHQFVK
ncbi:MAG TPA: DUF4870 domain-containing protein [Galbitalea sp.]|nr:DUF4870 domain-containing protein [Galbitalea sp.]